MGQSGDNGRLGKLIDLGRQRGYLTSNEISDLLPRHTMTAEQAADVQVLFGELGISIVDGERSAAATIQRRLADQTDRLFASVEAHLSVARFGVARFHRAWRDFAIPRRCWENGVARFLAGSRGSPALGRRTQVLGWRRGPLQAETWVYGKSNLDDPRG